MHIDCFHLVTTNHNINDAFFLSCLSVIFPPYLSSDLLMTDSAFRFMIADRIFPLPLWAWGSPLIIPGPSLLMASICIYTRFSLDLALTISSSNDWKKESLSSFFQFSWGPYPVTTLISLPPTVTSKSRSSNSSEYSSIRKSFKTSVSLNQGTTFLFRPDGFKDFKTTIFGVKFPFSFKSVSSGVWIILPPNGPQCLLCVLL